MKKYIYLNSGLRCRLKPTGYKNEIELQLQKLKYIFWINCFPWMTVQEGFWGECERFPVLYDSYQYGNKSECYMTGTFDLEKRVEKLFKEYVHELSNIDEFKKKFQAL